VKGRNLNFHRKSCQYIFKTRKCHGVRGRTAQNCPKSKKWFQTLQQPKKAKKKSSLQSAVANSHPTVTNYQQANLQKKEPRSKSLKSLSQKNTKSPSATGLKSTSLISIDWPLTKRKSKNSKTTLRKREYLY